MTKEAAIEKLYGAIQQAVKNGTVRDEGTHVS
jgi:hypothetical protein